jgi:hypothetical protein
MKGPFVSAGVLISALEELAPYAIEPGVDQTVRLTANATVVQLMLGLQDMVSGKSSDPQQVGGEQFAFAMRMLHAGANGVVLQVLARDSESGAEDFDKVHKLLESAFKDEE